MSLGAREKIKLYWQALMMAVDFRASSSLPTKSLMFWVMTICMPLYFRMRLASWNMKSRARGYLASIKTWASSMTTMIFRLAPYFRLYSRFLMISLSRYFSTSSIWALATVLFRLASRDWKLNTMKFSTVDRVDGPFQMLAFRPRWKTWPHSSSAPGGWT